jgi:hypothetical protein
MNKLLIIITILSLLFSFTLLVKEYQTVERWQEKGLKLYNKKLQDFNSWKTCVDPGKPEKWLTANPVFISLKTWVEMLSNLASLIIAISSLGVYTRLKRQKAEKT